VAVLRPVVNNHFDFAPYIIWRLYWFWREIIDHLLNPAILPPRLNLLRDRELTLRGDFLMSLLVWN
jgi:hypothetical protein